MEINLGEIFDEEDLEFSEEDILFTMIDMGMEVKPEKIKEWFQSHRILKEIKDVFEGSLKEIEASDNPETEMRNLLAVVASKLWKFEELYKEEDGEE